MRDVRPHKRLYKLDTPWPPNPFTVALVEPQIPPNTGNIARTCAATGCSLHLVGKLGFSLDDRYLKRAGLDYWDAVSVSEFPDPEAYVHSLPSDRFHLFTTAGSRLYTEVDFHEGDTLLFGSETQGLPDRWLECYPERTVAIPIRPEAVRSLNLAVSVGVALFEALRKIS